MTPPAENAAAHPRNRAMLAAGGLIAAMSVVPVLFDTHSPISTPLPSAAIKIDPNTASRDELMLLPGVGPVLADSIVAERSTNQRMGFASVEALDRVPRIGPKTIERLRPHIESPTETPRDDE